MKIKGVNRKMNSEIKYEINKFNEIGDQKTNFEKEVKETIAVFENKMKEQRLIIFLKIVEIVNKMKNEGYSVLYDNNFRIEKIHILPNWNNALSMEGYYVKSDGCSRRKIEIEIVFLKHLKSFVCFNEYEELFLEEIKYTAPC